MTTDKDIAILRSQLDKEVGKFWEAKIATRADELARADQQVLEATSSRAHIFEYGISIKEKMIEQFRLRMRNEHASRLVRPFLRKHTVDIAFGPDYHTMRSLARVGLNSPIINLASSTDTIEAGWQTFVPAAMPDEYGYRGREPRVDELASFSGGALDVFFAAKDKETGTEVREKHFSVDFSWNRVSAYRQGPDSSYDASEESCLALQGILQQAYKLYQ